MSSSLFARLLVSLLLCAGALGFLPRCHGAAEVEVPPGYVTVSAARFEPSSTCSAPDPAAPRRNGTSAVLRLTHRHGPCAPSRTSSLATPSVAETLQADQRRAEYILRRVSGVSAAAAGRIQGVGCGDGAGELGLRHRHAQLRGDGEPGHAGRGADAGGGHRQRPVVGAMQAVRVVVLQPEGLALRPRPVVVVRRRAVRRVRVRGAGHLRVRVLRGAVRVRGQLRRRVQHDGRVQLRHADTDADGRGGGVPLRLRARAERAVHRHRRAPRPRPPAGVAGGAGGGRVRRRLLLLPPDEAVHHGIPDAGWRCECRGAGVRDDAAADVAERADVLHRDADEHERGRAGAERAGVGVRGRDGVGHGHGGDPAAPGGVRGAAVGVPEPHGGVRVPGGAAERDPGHVLQLRRIRQCDAAHRGAHVQQRRGGATLTLGADGILSFGCLAFAPSGSDGGMAILGNVQQRSFEVRIDGESVEFKPASC